MWDKRIWRWTWALTGHSGDVAAGERGGQVADLGYILSSRDTGARLLDGGVDLIDGGIRDDQVLGEDAAHLIELVVAGVTRGGRVANLHHSQSQRDNEPHER